MINRFPLCVLFLVSSALSQPHVRFVDGIPVTNAGGPITLPFAGGVNSPNHQFVDIDGDGDLDLFILDDDLFVDFYRNEGTAAAPDFRLRTGAIELPSFSVWYLFVDFDGDGLLDLVTEDDQFNGVRVYKNVGTPQSPQFVLHIPRLLDNNSIPVSGGQSSIPAFIDIDADGDLDFFSGNVTGTINFYRNIGSATNPLYQFVTGSWFDILVIGDTCTQSSPAGPRHGASAFRFADVDGDGDFDFHMGDVFHIGMFEVLNTGTPGIPNMVCNTAWYPPSSPVITGGFNQPTFADIDGDGDLDLFVGVLGGIVQRDGFHFLRNNGTPTAPNLQLQTKNFISTIDVGRNAHPRFADIDSDGDLDMFIGGLDGKIAFYRNTGTATAPAFLQVDSAFISIPGSFALVPAFVDIDADGDLDLFVSRFDAPMVFFRNTGTPQSPVFQQQPSPMDAFSFPQFNAAFFVDIDNDGDKDVFVGRNNGRLSFLRNMGSATDFQPVLETNAFQQIVAGLNAVPYFTDITGDGKFDLFIGTAEGRVEYYENIGTPQVPTYIRITNHYAGTSPMQEASPALVDIDGDGDIDMFVGTSKGGVHYYRNDLIVSVTEEPGLALSFRLEQNYPNPFNPSTRIGVQLRAYGHVKLGVYDILGREVATLVNAALPAGSFAVEFNAAGLASGVYFYRLTTAGRAVTRKMVLVE